MKEKLKKLKENIEHTRQIFGYPSADRATRMFKFLAGEFEGITIDEKESVLPKWLLEKGLMNMYDFIRSRKDIKDEIEMYKKSANRKNRSKTGKEIDLSMIKRA